MLFIFVFLFCFSSSAFAMESIIDTRSLSVVTSEIQSTSKEGLPKWLTAFIENTLANQQGNAQGKKNKFFYDCYDASAEKRVRIELQRVRIELQRVRIELHGQQDDQEVSEELRFQLQEAYPCGTKKRKLIGQLDAIDPKRTCRSDSDLSADTLLGFLSVESKKRKGEIETEKRKRQKSNGDGLGELPQDFLTAFGKLTMQ